MRQIVKAREVQIGDRLGGHEVAARVQADHAPGFIRFYFTVGNEPAEYMPHDPVVIERGAHWGDVVQPDEAGRCGRCGFANFRYSNGNEVSRSGVRGYRCVQCGSVKPERRA